MKDCFFLWCEEQNQFNMHIYVACYIYILHKAHFYNTWFGKHITIQLPYNQNYDPMKKTTANKPK